MSPDFLTPIYYFKPYPGSELVIEAVERGFRLPETLEAWAQFDYVAGSPGPWVSPEKFELIERFKFFHELAWKRMPPRQATAAATRALSLWPGQLPLARRDVVHTLAGPDAEAVMTAQRRVLLINPQITARRHARFPLSLMSLSASARGSKPSARSSMATSTATSSRPPLSARCARSATMPWA